MSKHAASDPRGAPARGPASSRALAFIGVSLAAAVGLSAGQGGGQTPAAGGDTKLEDTRVVLGKMIETQQIITKERKDWQQGKEVLVGRLELVKQEVSALQAKIEQARSSIAESAGKRAGLDAENAALEATAAQLAQTVTVMESEIRRLFRSLPEPVQTRLQPLHQRIPEDPAQTRVSVAERYQNVLGILDMLNKANNEITLHYEIHTLSDGKTSEVQAIYVGLAQAYYVSPSGEAGVGRPAPEGWKWEPSPAVSSDVLKALEILQGKQSPAFVPLPVKLQ